MKTTRQACVTAALVGLFGAAATAALEPNEVLVVANGASADSMALAKLYLQQRAIPERNLVELHTTTRPDVSRAAYDSEIAGPIRKALEDRKLKEHIRCICVMYGVPIRVGAPAAAAPPPASSQPALGAGAGAVTAERYHYRLAMVHSLLETIGKEFPAPRTRELAPLGELFAASVAEPPQPLMSVEKLREDVRRLLGAAQNAVDRLDDPAKKKIAVRQLMAVHLELGGLEGLIDYIRDNRPEDAPDREGLEKQLEAAQAELSAQRREHPEARGEMLALVEKVSGLLTAMDIAAGKLVGRMGATRKSARGQPAQPSSSPSASPAKGAPAARAEAAVDSELALLWWDDYELKGWVVNPLHWRLRKRAGAGQRRVLMTARLDGPSRGDVTRMIKIPPAVEKHGLAGTFYVDVGGPDRVPAPARQAYDARLRATYDFVRSRTELKAVLDDKPTVFPKDSCPGAALYVGWYSLKKYVPAFSWEPGAVAWHVASWEAVNLRDPNSQEWCPKMIQHGVAATLGAVSEPFLQHFPNPDEFFPLLLTGKLTLAECYWATIPAASWQLILLGDPLYTPFGAKSPLKVEGASGTSP